MTDPTSDAGKGSPSRAASRVAEHGQAGTAITPAAALARHLEWLEFALAAARSEETWRSGRLEKATKKNRERRGTRLAEVQDEIAELSALVAAIRGLSAPASRRGPGRPRGSGTKASAGGTATKAATPRTSAPRKSAPRKSAPRRAASPKTATPRAAAASGAPRVDAAPTAPESSTAPIADATATAAAPSGSRRASGRTSATNGSKPARARKPRTATPKKPTTAPTSRARRADRPAADGPA